ncbi:MAG: type II toxin-antitoxin system HicA family toxin [Thermodesulfobacteriota bacterium]
MKSVSGKELCSVLKRHGWSLYRVHGSHHVLAKAGTVVRISVPVHGNQPLKSGLLKRLMTLAELSTGDL